MGVPSFSSVRNWGFPQTMFSNKISSNKNIPYNFREQEIQIKAFWELGMTCWQVEWINLHNNI